MTERTATPARSLLTSTLIATLAASLLCAIARADDLNAGRPVRIRPPAFAPIGKVSSIGEMSINRRLRRGEQSIWGGDLLQVFEDASASVVLDSLGQVVLQRATTLRLATHSGSTDGKGAAQILIISLTSGNIRVQLQQHASAYLETCGAAFTTTSGASFRVEIREDKPVITVSSGAVEIDPSNQDVEYIVEPVIADPLTGRPTKRAPSTISVPPSKPGTVQQQQVSVKVSARNKKTKRITPAGPGRKVTIALLTPGVGEVGSQSVTVVTNDFGVATTTFTAGPNPGETRIRATDESGAEWVGKIIVATTPGFWRTRNNIRLGAAAAATAAIIIFIDRHGGGKHLRQEPPPIIP